MREFMFKSSSQLRIGMFLNRIMPRLILLGAVTLGLFAAASPAQEAEALFNQKCANCHGKDGSGHTAAAAKMTMPDFKSKQLKEMSDVAMADSIANGTKHYAYPHAFLHTGMTSEQIDGLVKYIRTLQSDKKPTEKK